MLNATIIGYPRTANKASFNIHVSDAIETTGPRAFCARYFVQAYHSTRVRVGGKITPARKLLFATGHFLHDYVVKEFMENSPYAAFVYANWTCEHFEPYDPSTHHHKGIVDIAANVSSKSCPSCKKPLTKHNEIDLILPKLRLVGHPDMIIRLGVGPMYKFYIHEFKTMDRKDVDFDSLTVPLAGHRLQVSFYYKIMRAMGYNVSNKLRIVYIDRSNSKLWGGFPYKTIVCEPEADEFLTPFKNRIAHVNVGIATRRLPERICDSIKADRAKNCDLAIECFQRRLRHV